MRVELATVAKVTLLFLERSLLLEVVAVCITQLVAMAVQVVVQATLPMLGKELQTKALMVALALLVFGMAVVVVALELSVLVQLQLTVAMVVLVLLQQLLELL
jgi:hypothetical protein